MGDTGTPYKELVIESGITDDDEVSSLSYKQLSPIVVSSSRRNNHSGQSDYVNTPVVIQDCLEYCKRKSQHFILPTRYGHWKRVPVYNYKSWRENNRNLLPTVIPSNETVIRETILRPGED